jgi:hypothetical protein
MDEDDNGYDRSPPAKAKNVSIQTKHYNIDDIENDAFDADDEDDNKPKEDDNGDNSDNNDVYEEEEDVNDDLLHDNDEDVSSQNCSCEAISTLLPLPMTPSNPSMLSSRKFQGNYYSTKYRETIQGTI